MFMYTADMFPCSLMVPDAAAVAARQNAYLEVISLALWQHQKLFLPVGAGTSWNPTLLPLWKEVAWDRPQAWRWKGFLLPFLTQ